LFTGTSSNEPLLRRHLVHTQTLSGGEAEASGRLEVGAPADGEPVVEEEL
jgi:hypothetical protein